MAAVNPRSDTRNLIIDAAERLVAERGVGSASLGAVAAEAGVSRGTLYWHFPTKEDLVLEVAERHMEAITERIVARAREDFRQATEEAGDRGAALAGILESLAEAVIGDRTRSSIHLHLVHGVFQDNEELQLRLAKSYNRWLAAVAEELLSLGLEQEEARVAAGLLVAALDGLIIQHKVLGAARSPSAGETAAFFAAAFTECEAKGKTKAKGAKA